MTTSTLDPQLDELLSQRTWLRGLAVALVGQGALADDLVQDTWESALRHPPATDRPVRPWLASVLRNAARMRFRSDRRRAGRELGAREPHAQPPTPASLLERVQTHRLLADAVLGLDEPFRTTVMLRYVEGLSAAEIARQQEVPAGTVRWRLKEGLDRLRADLDRAHGGDRRAWFALVAPVATAAPAAAGGTATWIAGVVTMKAATTALVATGIAVATVAALYHWKSDDGRSTTAGTAVSQATAPSAARPGPSPAPAADRPGAQPTAGQLRRFRNAAARARFAEALARARKLREEETPAAPEPEAESASLPPPMRASSDRVAGLSKEYIQDQIREVLPLIKECYELQLAEDPTLQGSLIADFIIAGEPEIGGFVAEAHVDQASTITHPGVRECFNETILSLEFDPPENGGSLRVRYPFEFRAAAEGEEDYSVP